MAKLIDHYIKTLQYYSITSHHVSANLNAALQSFNLSWGSLPPADNGSCEIEMFALLMGVVTPMSVNQFFTSSGPPTTMQLDAAITMAGLFKEQVEEIFCLTCEAQKLGRKIAHDFINLPNQEALFCMGIQATGYEQVASGHPDRVTAYYMMIRSEGMEAEKLDEAFDGLCQEVGEAWLDTNFILFRHALEYQNKLSDFLKDSKEAIEALHDHIWMVVLMVMEDAGAPVSKGLGITVCLVDMLPTILIHLAFYSSTPGLTSFTPEVYAAWSWFRTDVLDLMHTQPLQSDRKALDVLCEEITKTWVVHQRWPRLLNQPACFSMAPLSTIGGRADAKSAPVMAPPIVHVHHILQTGIARPSLGLHSIILRVHDPVNLPLALVPDLGVCQEPVV